MEIMLIEQRMSTNSLLCRKARKYFKRNREYWEGGIVSSRKHDSEFEYNISAISKCSALCTPISTAIIINSKHSYMYVEG